MMKAMDSALWPGANRSDTSWYREDLQQRHRAEDALSFFEISAPVYQGLLTYGSRLQFGERVW